MNSFLIRGGNSLYGDVVISGSKNAALPCLFATLLTKEVCVFENIPDLVDVKLAYSLLSSLGKKIVFNGRYVEIITVNEPHSYIEFDLAKQIRASVLLLAPILVKAQEIYSTNPGGCAIGDRPINLHLDCFIQLGCDVSIKDELISLKVKKLVKKKEINLQIPSVCVTENLLMFAAAIDGGDILIRNAAVDPEVVDLSLFLIKMGADIQGAGTSVIRVRGVKNLSGVKHRLIPDRIEAMTYMISSIITKGEVCVKNIEISHIQILIDIFRKMGHIVHIRDDKTSIICKYASNFSTYDVSTDFYPLFPTDIQSQWMALMCLTRGYSVVVENIFENRFLHVKEFIKMGAKISVFLKTAIIDGGQSMHGSQVYAHDLRSSAALVLLALSIPDTSTVFNLYHLYRGYESPYQKLVNLGSNVQILSS